MSEGIDRQGGIERILSTLAKHGRILAMAMDSTIEVSDRTSKKSIDELVSISALKPYEEGVYRLNPRLRDYLADHLVTYNAYQNLTRISDLVSRCKAQWGGLLNFRENGAIADADQLEWAIEDTVAEISYAIERNITLLNAMVSSQYGNVATLTAKRSQNRFYAQEVSASLNEMDLIDHLVDDLAGEALAQGMLAFRRKLNTHLGAKLLSWRSQLKDAQSNISKRLFRAKQLEKQLNNLSRVALWLNQNKAKDGFDMIEIAQDTPSFMARPEALTVRPQIDVHDLDPMTMDTVVRACEKLPAKKALAGADDPKPKVRQPVATAQVEVIPEEVMPEDAEIDLIVHALHTQGGSTSLLDWKRGKPDALSAISDEEWLLYASEQLATQGIAIAMRTVQDSSKQTENALFVDFVASAPHSS